MALDHPFIHPGSNPHPFQIVVHPRIDPCFATALGLQPECPELFPKRATLNDYL